MRIVDKVFNNNNVAVSFAAFADEYYDYHYKDWTNYFSKARANLSALKAGNTPARQAFITDIVQFLEPIIKATAVQIPALITKFTAAKYQGVLNDVLFRKDIEKAFGYEAFRKSAKASWFAARFEIKACLYCNAQYTLGIGKDGRKKQLLFQFDHFFNKAAYPFLSLTLGNLIPSCSSCNIAKSRTPFTLSTHVHPYTEDLNTMADFRIDQDKALEYLMGNRDAKLLTPTLSVTDKRFTEHDRVFRLKDIYAKHTDVIEELILKMFYYNTTRRSELKKEFSDLNISQTVIDRFVLGNYTLDSEINKRPLSKLARDIARQLKIV